jgi:hypothetical protein
MRKLVSVELHIVDQRVAKIEATLQQLANVGNDDSAGERPIAIGDARSGGAGAGAPLRLKELLRLSRVVGVYGATNEQTTRLYHGQELLPVRTPRNLKSLTQTR